MRLLGSAFKDLSESRPDLLPPSAIKGWDSFPQDITAITAEDVAALPHIDLVGCGWPCQGMSKANRDALGLRDPRSHVLFDVVKIIQLLEEKQLTGVGWIMENVDTEGSNNAAIKLGDKYIKKMLGGAVRLDEAGCGGNHHRVRRFWSNLADMERVKRAWERREQCLPPLLTEVLPSHLRPQVNLPTPPGGVRVNKPGQPRALPTILARADSDAYRGDGAGMLWNTETWEWERPDVALKEQLFGYKPGVVTGVKQKDMERLIGNAMGLHSISWLFGQLLVEQQRLRDLAQLAQAARAVKAAQREQERRKLKKRHQQECNAAWDKLCQQALCCWLLLLWVGGTSLQCYEAGPLGHTTMLAMFVAVVHKSVQRYRRKVTATSKAGRRAFGANAVSDGGGRARRAQRCAAAWANKRYGQMTSMNELVESVPSNRDPSKEWQCGRDRTPAQQQQLVQLCDNYWDSVWVWTVSNLPAVKHWEFRIPTTNDQPIKRAKYRLSKTEWEYVDNWCKELLEAGAIRESQSPYAIPVVCPPKKDDDGNWTGIRVCLDARPLNNVTESWAYVMPKADELLSKVAGARMYSGFDAKSAFHQLSIAEEDRHKTAFWGSDRQYEWCRMAMGFKNASQAWQRVMDEALSDLPFVAVYADDICVFSGNADMSDEEVFALHMQHLQKVFDRLAEAGIRLAPGKGRMAVEQIAFLGHWVGPEGVFPQHSKVEAVLNMPAPTDVAGVRRFLGMVGYYGKFIEQVAVKRKPLTKLTGKEPWEWGPAQQQAFEQLKADLVSAPVLRNPDWSRPFILHTDFSGAGLGAVLAQEDEDGNEYVVEFASRACQGAEVHYASYEGECLAMLYGMDKFRYYLFGRQFVVVTDHRPLEWLMSTAQLRGKLARWAMRLSEYDFVVRYRKGSAHLNADCLSRDPVNSDTEGGSEEADDAGQPVPRRHAAAYCCSAARQPNRPALSAWAARRVADSFQQSGGADGELVTVTGAPLAAQPRQSDPWLNSEAMATLQAGEINMQAPFARYIWKGDALWYLHKDGTHREVPPPSERDQIIMDVHVKMGHIGRDRLHSIMSASFYWPGLHEDVSRVKRACVECDRLQHRPGGTSGRPKAAAPLDMQPLPHYGLFYRWHLDLAGPFEATRDRNVWVLVMVEAASKWVELVPLRTKEAINIRRAFEERVMARFAAPGEVCTDGGTEFQGEFDDLLVEHDIDHRTTQAYHPQPNGLAEGMVKTVKEALMRYVTQPGKRVAWDTFLPSIEAGYRCSKQASTRYSPYELVYGRSPVFPAHARAIFEEQMVDFDSPEGVWEMMTARAEKLATMVPTAMQNIEAAQHREVMRYRRRRAGLIAPGLQQFSPGDFVYVQQRQQDALDPRVRPSVYKVYEVRDNGVVVIQGADGDTARVRVEELAKCSVPYVVLPAGFTDPDLACEECGDKVSRARNPILICDSCGRGWHKQCHQPPVRRVPRGAWHCQECTDTPAEVPRQPAIASSARQVGSAASDIDDSDEEFEDLVPKLRPTWETVEARLMWGMPGAWHPATVTKTLNRLQAVGGQLPIIRNETAEYAPLRDLIQWRDRVIFDPWAGDGATAAALQPWGVTVISNDLNPTYGCEMCEDALEAQVYQRARAVTGVMNTNRDSVFVIVTSPWFQQLDLALPLMAAQADILFVQVPVHYIAQGPAPRMQYLRHLGDCGRLHIVAGAGVRNRTTRRATLWLVIFRDSELREQQLEPQWRDSVASIHFHV